MVEHLQSLFFISREYLCIREIKWKTNEKSLNRHPIIDTLISKLVDRRVEGDPKAPFSLATNTFR